MNIEVNIPEEVFSSANPDVSRAVLEAVAAEGFRSKQLTTEQVRRLLGYKSKFQVHQFLAKRNIPWVNYSVEDAERESEMLRVLLGR